MRRKKSSGKVGRTMDLVQKVIIFLGTELGDMKSSGKIGHTRDFMQKVNIYDVTRSTSMSRGSWKIIENP